VQRETPRLQVKGNKIKIPNHNVDPGRDPAGGPTAAGVGIKINPDGGSGGREAEVVGTKRNPQGMEISSKESELSSLESELSDPAWVRKQMGGKRKTPSTTDDDCSIGDSDDKSEAQGGVKMDW
jgi:hypothetical protein